jgi:hypothetical protein
MRLVPLSALWSPDDCATGDWNLWYGEIGGYLFAPRLLARLGVGRLAPHDLVRRREVHESIPCRAAPGHLAQRPHLEPARMAVAIRLIQSHTSRSGEIAVYSAESRPHERRMISRSVPAMVITPIPVLPKPDVVRRENSL